MKLYHYSKEKFQSLKTRRKVGDVSKEEILESEEFAKSHYREGAYVDHISFFFDPVPLNIIGKLFKGKNDFWRNGNEIYEYIVDTGTFDKHITYNVVESVRKVKKLDKIDWIDTEEFFIQYCKQEKHDAEACGEIGYTLSDLENQIRLHQGTTEAMYLLASKRKDFDDNITKYAASVPHLMIYPSSGSIKIETISKRVVGNDIIKTSLESLVQPRYLLW